jgi:Leucine-rich repeat (LRR) protein
MRNVWIVMNCTILLFLACTGGLPSSPPTQNTTNFDDMELFIRDTLVARAILDSNGLYALSYVSVTNVDPHKGRITELLLKNRGLTTIPPVFDSTSALTKITISQNPDLHALPNGIGKLPRLKELKVHHNGLDSLPADIGNCDSLTILYLFGNACTSLPEEFGGLPMITAIEAGDNNLTSLPLSFTQLSNLSYIAVSGNKLCDIQENVAHWLDTNAYSKQGWRNTQICD